MKDDQQGDARSDQTGGSQVAADVASGGKAGAVSRGRGLSKDSPAEAVEPAGELTPEEQMELYENDLKEKDWGHQPC